MQFKSSPRLALLTIAVVSGIAFGQSASALLSPKFDSADVHVSAPGITPAMTGGAMRGGRYELHHAAMLDLIRTAWGVDADRVIGGPSWLEKDRFDVIAKTAAATSPDQMLLMLRRLLADRFQLVVHDDRKLLPAFVLATGRRPQLKRADGTGDTGCQLRQQSTNIAGHVQNAVTACRNVTMTDFAARLRGIGGSYITHPVVDQTGLTGTWDFDITWTGQTLLVLAGSDGITFFEATDRQLGLKLEAKNISMPVVIVDSVNREPSDNAPGTTQSPSGAPTEFEVAEIKPSEPGATEHTEFLPGGRMSFRAVALKALIEMAWNIRGDDMLASAPKWVDERFDVIAKAPAASLTGDGTKGLPMDMDAFRLMMRTLLEDRFKLTAHNEERPASVYALVAGKPKLTRADPSNRTGCRQSTGNAGTGASIVMTFSYTCQNTTMAQFAYELQQGGMGDVAHPVVDSTGLGGAWDFAVTWTPQVWAKAGSGSGRSDDSAGVATPSDPSVGLTLAEALDRQLGLKLEMQKRTVSVLVIDHIERNPTDN